MPERHQESPRPTVMRKPLLALALVLPLVISGCGDGGTTRGSSESASGAGPSACAGATAPASVAEVDLDGDGTPESVGFVPAVAECPAHLATTVSGHDLSADLSDGTTVTASQTAAVTLPGRTGDVLLVRTSHPRGGFQAHLFGYADRKFAELTAEGKPVFDFIATDAMSTPTAARCDGDGFAVVQARPHEPIGVAAAWDVFRTVYSVDGNTVTRGATSETAENVLDHELQSQYADLVSYDFFQDCLAKR